MKRRLKEPFGKAGLTVAVIALVFALIGGAYAAGGLSKSQVKQVTKIAKKYAGKPGATGPAGAAGTNGTNGTNGKDGVAGTPGKDGVGVTGAPISTSSATCSHQGGSAYTSASGTENVCNGTTGFTKTLPKSETERGVWSVIYTATAPGQLGSADISFNIPLETAPEATKVNNFVGLEEGEGEAEENTTIFPGHCTGNIESPGAKPGNLCVFARNLVNEIPGPIGALFVNAQDGTLETSGVGGASLDFGSVAAGPVLAFGAWAVTAEE